MKTKLFILSLSSALILLSAAPAAAAPAFSTTVDGYMNEIYVYNGIQNTDTALLESAVIQSEIAELKQSVEAFQSRVLNDDSLSAEELTRLEDQISQCLEALESLTA